MKSIIRHAEKTIIRIASEYPSVLVTGARQTGKTTLLKKITEQKSVPYLSFDDPAEELSAKNDAKTFMEFHQAPFMFDEIQYVPELFRYLKIEIDKNRNTGMYFLTGSQQFHLMEAATESLSGRIGIVQLYPFSQRELRGDDFSEPFIPTREYLLERNSTFINAKTEFSIQKTWKSIHRGFFPEVALEKVTPNDFYANYLKTYIERDIRKLTQVADELQFMQFISVVASRTSQLVNYSDLADECSISEVTAKKWLSLLVTSGLVYLLKPYAVNVEKRVVKTPKLYFMDTGLAAYLTKWTNPEVMQNGAMAGAFFETYAVSEIIKSFANAGFEPPVYFYRDKDKKEIDLIIEKDNILYPIEIKKSARPTIDMAKHFSVLSKIAGVSVGQGCIICQCDNPLYLSNEVISLPVEYV